MATNKNPGALAGATGAGKPIHATADGTRNIANDANQRQPRKGVLYVVNTSDGDTLRIHLKGRNRWALEELRKAGARGCTPIDNPAPRWAAYVHNLRDLGVEIETITEKHGGEFAGTHARYVLRSDVQKGGAR